MYSIDILEIGDRRENASMILHVPCKCWNGMPDKPIVDHENILPTPIILAKKTRRPKQKYAPQQQG